MQAGKQCIPFKYVLMGVLGIQSESERPPDSVLSWSVVEHFVLEQFYLSLAAAQLLPVAACPCK